MKSEKGQSLVEFALILPLLVMLLFGIADFGRAFHAYLTIDHVGREVARAVSVGDEAKVGQIVENNGKSIGLTSSMVVFPKDLTNKTVTVTINYTFNFITPLFGNMPIPLSDTTTMRLE